MSSFRVFLSKKMKSSNKNPMFKMSWNKANGFIAGGYSDGMISLLNVTPSRDQPGSQQVETIESLDIHSKRITALSWSDNGRLLASGDSSGKIAFFAKKEKGWKNVVINSSLNASVNSIVWAKNSKMAAIAYKDGPCACVTAEGNLDWTTMMRQVIEFLDWSPNSKILLGGTAYGEVLIIDSRGVEINTVPLPCLSNSKSEPKIVALEWHKRAEYGLLIAFKDGNIQLMRNESDTQPFVISMELEISTATWFKSGQNFVTAGVKPNGRAVAIFFNSHGDNIRELELQGKEIHAISLDPTDTSLAIASDNHFCLAQIVPHIIWGYTNNVLCYCYLKGNDDISTAIFFNRKSEEKRVQQFRDLVTLSAHSSFFVFATKNGADESTLTVTNTIGVVITSSHIPFIPIFSSSCGQTVALVSQNKICVWRFQEDEQPQVLDFADTITTAHLTEKLLYISTSTQIVVLDVPSMAEVTRYTTNFASETIGVSSNGAILSLNDSYGTVQFFSTEEKRIIGPVCKEVWVSAWASDAPEQFAALERQKLVVFNDLEPEEPVSCLSHIAEFSELEILTINLIWLLKDPMNPSTRFFRSHQTKQLRQLHQMLSARPETSVEDIFAFAKKENKPKLWDSFAETVMLEMNFSLTERCYLETTNYRGLQFVKRIRTVKDPNIQRAQVLSYLGRFDEAESIYLSMDRLDLAIEMRRSIGDFRHVIKIMGNGVGDDETIAAAYTAVGDELCEQAHWSDATMEYSQARNDEKLMKARFLAQDYDGLERLMMSLPAQSPLLHKIGEMFVAIGAVDDAVTAFTSCGDIAAAIDACARMNHWKPALKLASKGRNMEIKARMVKYAEDLIANGQRASAVDFYVRAGLNIEAAKLLLKAGDEILAIGDDYISAKMCYIFAGIQLEQHRKGAFDGSATAEERLDGLMKEDEVTTSGLHREVWRKAEGVHFLLLANRFYQERKYKDALVAACRVFDDYSDIVGEARASSLLALCGLKKRFFGQCSRAMTTLEHSDELSQAQREKFEDLAIDIFTRNQPVDQENLGSVQCPKCSAVVFNTSSQCPECGERLKVCTYSARLIDGQNYWECKYCKHYVMIDLVDELRVCPLCHHKVTQ
ncbi:WD repeat protein, putative [Trichomonas vaginalis G3]|uniref:WD repeat protein, putative n=1 Tax=Trichomonas vaginalis (strain ATCC PRA-98 / G3) TaxID=412133 RepID=A2DBT3_TRIV3|nr:WD repeat-containing protein 35 family [Trichomonas vaginalis G3]EAY22286.1 WD repeat protein, putative [Trichomonas vaginalis G3]KAI5533243.1 WD repeat-containing protein 35 family [Trichomonas vaginalis G3]|eukprot:XP_001583272.1 WD repeat protein [Trichomonas vaginalis G3]